MLRGYNWTFPNPSCATNCVVFNKYYKKANYDMTDIKNIKQSYQCRLPKITQRMRMGKNLFSGPVHGSF